MVGGIWLIGKVSRNSPAHPVTAAAVALAPPQAAGNTVGTQQDGSPSLVSGEPLAPPTPPLPSNVGIMTVSGTNQHIATPPMVSNVRINPIPMRFNPVPTVPKPVVNTPISTYANRVPTRGKFIDL